MRGWLRIASSRAPFRRAGLAWAGKEPVEVDIRSLDGERLHKLLHDPVLTIEIGKAEGGFGPMPFTDRSVTPDVCQMMIDSVVEELGPYDPASSPLQPVYFGLDMATGPDMTAIAVRLEGLGFVSIDDALDQLKGAESRLELLTADLAAERTDHDAAKLLVSQGEESLRIEREKVAELEAEVAELKAKAAPKPKTAPKD